jgi:NAD(P) transhydrogenase subunit alpha
MDLAALNGGNCELTVCDKIVTHNGVIIDGRSNLPGTMPEHSSQLYSKNLFNLFSHIYKNESIDFEDEIVNGSMLLNKGKINNPTLQQFVDGENK